ncbi:MAG: DUF2312 domain-containing protein [Rhizomicrobium sp.]
MGTKNKTNAKTSEPVARTGVAEEMLRSFIDRIERLTTEKSALSDDLRAVYAEVKQNGFDIRVMRIIVRLRRLERNDFLAQEALSELYKRTLGMIG